MSTLFINISLVSFMVVIALMITFSHRLFAIIIMSGAYSLISAAMFVNLDAVDVAFTEAAVGAGFSTVLFLAAMAWLPAEEKRNKALVILPLIICLFTGSLLIWAVAYLPALGDPASVVHQHVAPRYLAESYDKLHIPNVVTTVLASYRGFDTLGETIVIFTAGLGVLLILMGKTGRSPKPKKVDISAKVSEARDEDVNEK